MDTDADDAQGRATHEPALRPDLPVVDAHIHLWDRDNYFAHDFVADCALGHNVQASVYVECSMAYSDDMQEEMRPVGETRFVLDQVRQAGAHGIAQGGVVANGILCSADLTLGERAGPVLDAHAEAAEGRLRGVRYRVARDPDPVAGYGETGYSSIDLLKQESVVAGAAELERRGLVLDLWGFHTQLDDIGRLAARLPGLTVVVDHAGGPLGVGRYAGRRAEVFKHWSAAIRRLAALPNVHIKLSGLGISRIGFGFQDHGPAASSDELARMWRPYVDTCAEAFGPTRSLFSSNYPVDRAAGAYSTLLNAYKRMLGTWSDDEQRAIFAGNARRLYRLP